MKVMTGEMWIACYRYRENPLLQGKFPQAMRWFRFTHSSLDVTISLNPELKAEYDKYGGYTKKIYDAMVAREGNLPVPSWDEYYDGCLEYSLYIPRMEATNRQKEIEEAQVEAARAFPISIGETGLTVDARIDFIDALVHLHNSSQSAGSTFPVSRWEDSNGNLINLWQYGKTSRVLQEIARREVQIESARNKARQDYRALETVFGDDNAAFGDIDAALKKSAAASDKFNDDFTTELQSFDPDAIPDDLPTLKSVLMERLEAAATGHQKDLKDAITQQAIDNWAACVDMDTALAETAKRCAVASIEIARADDADAAKAAFNEGVKQVNAVRAANTPHWTVSHSGGTRVAFNEANPASPKRYTDTTVTVTARHPDGKTIPGNCVIREIPRAVDEATGKPVPSSTSFTKNDDGSFTAKVEVSGRPSGAKTLITFTGRNICGPSRIRIELVQPLVTP